MASRVEKGMVLSTSSTDNLEPAAKRVKRAYSDYEKDLIVKADEKGGIKLRHEVASLIDMPTTTADHVVSAFNNGKDVYDHRHDRKVHLGKNSKKDSELLACLQEWLHMDAHLTLRELRDLINLEVFRKICLEEKLDLPNGEDQPNHAIALERIREYLKNDKVLEKYGKRHVENERTIANWLDGLIVSRKHVLEDALKANDDKHTATRLVFANELVKALEDESAVLVFLNETPMYLKMHHPPGHSEDVRINCNTEIRTALSPTLGFIGADLHSPQALPGPAIKEGAHHNPVIFKRFLQNVLQRLVDRADELKGKAVYIIADMPDEYLDSVRQHKSIHTVPAFEELHKLLNGGCFLIKQAVDSPTLNLGEFLDKEVRKRANDLLHELVVNEEQHKDFLVQNGKGHHDDLLEKILHRVIEELKDYKVESSKLVRLIDITKDVSTQKGKLDFQKTYDFLL